MDNIQRKRRRTIKYDGPDSIDVEVGSKVRARRKELRISQSKMGDAIGVTFQQVQKYENGVNRIGASNLYKISKVLGVDVSYFFGGVSRDSNLEITPPNSFPVEDPMVARDSIELLHNYLRIRDERTRKQFGLLLKTLAKLEE